MELGEIVLPQTRPESEWIDGRALQKVSPTRGHGRLAMRVASALDRWAGDRGQVAVEWRFRVRPPGEPRAPLVPDVAYVASERLRTLTYAEAESPPFSPDVAIEIASPGDRESRIAAKTEVYLRCETSLVIVIDPAARSARTIDHAGERVFRGDDVLAHPALPGFSLALGPLFEALDLPRAESATATR